jgi:hypothetical protein
MTTASSGTLHSWARAGLLHWSKTITVYTPIDNIDFRFLDTQAFSPLGQFATDYDQTIRLPQRLLDSCLARTGLAQ